MAAYRAASASGSIPAYAMTAGRAVHVKIRPQPLNLAESTEVLRVLQQFGDVVMYKHLKHEPNLHAPNSAVAIFQSSSSAEKIIDASPLGFQLRRTGSSPQSSGDDGASQQTPSLKAGHEKADISPEQTQSEIPGDGKKELESLAKGRGVMRERPAGSASFTGFNAATQRQSPPYAQASYIQTPTPRTPRPFTSNPMPSSTTSTSLPYPPSPSSDSVAFSQDSEDTRQFRLEVTRSVLDHQAYIKRQHYYGGFSLERMNVMAEDLEERVPVKGMMDCQMKKEEVPLRVRLKRQDDEEKSNNDRKTLMELWEEGKNERGSVAFHPSPEKRSDSSVHSEDL